MPNFGAFICFISYHKVIYMLFNQLSKDQMQTKSVLELFDQSIIHLILAHDVEVVRFKTLIDLSAHLHTLSRTIDSPIERSLTAFSCLQKYNAIVFTRASCSLDLNLMHLCTFCCY